MIPGLKNSYRRKVAISQALADRLRLFTHEYRFAIGSGSRQSQRRVLCRHWHKLTASTIPGVGRRINLHALRHTAFSRLYSATKDLLLVKQWAGHKSVNSTMVYMHLEASGAADSATQLLLKNLAS
jgi:integrase